MCGRYTLATPGEELVEVFQVPPLSFTVEPHYNIAPGQDGLVVAEDARGRRMGKLRWGLLPSWAKAPGRVSINARGETVARAPSFRDAFARRRCLVPADGFYEWRRGAEGNAPFHFRPVAGGVLALAAIWEHWEMQGHEARDGFALLTVAANADVAPVHARMPVVIPPGEYEAWLDRATPLDRVLALVRPLPDGSLRSHGVSTRVNAVAEDDAGLVEPNAPPG